MWPFEVDWRALQFGVELEFVGGDPLGLPLLPGWKMDLGERQFAEDGTLAGAELKPPPLGWAERRQIAEMLGRLRASGAQANWSCGLHVHVGLEPWGEEMLLPLIDAALQTQEALATLLQTTDHRRLFCPPVTLAMRQAYLTRPERASLVQQGRPQSHRCGINTAAWFDYGTVEIRLANGSLDECAVLRTVELCLRFVAAVGSGQSLPTEAGALALALGVPADGYPPPAPAPLWHQERMWLEEALIPVLAVRAAEQVPGGEILDIRPVPEGLLVRVEESGDRLHCFRCRITATGCTFDPLHD